jgi:hypothetical protein
VAICVAAAAGCGRDSKPDSTKAAPEDLGATAPKSSETDRLAMQGSGLDLRLTDTSPTRGDSRKPTFWLHADTYSLADENIWSFEKARAIIYGRGEHGTEIHLEAGQGRFQENTMAQMKGGVDVQFEDMRLQLSDMEWINAERVARTDHPVSVASNSVQLQAATLRLYPDEKQLVMTDAVGTMRFDAMERERKTP